MTVQSTLREDLNALTPRLRRYARALASGGAGSSELADDIVQATLMRAIGARHLGVPADRVVRVYATATQLHRDVSASKSRSMAAGVGGSGLAASGTGYLSVRRPSRLAAALMNMPLEDREALLLVAVEGFDYGDAARILRISRNQLLDRLTQARIALDSQLGARLEPSTRVCGGSHLRLVT